MGKLEIGKWYHSKRKCLCRLDKILDDKVLVTVHYTGNKIPVYLEETEYFVEAPKPNIAPGTAMITTITEKPKDHKHLYTKYPHIIEDSIYSVKSTNTPNEEILKVDGKIRVKIPKTPKGATRCKIQCQTVGCNNTKDIKVQDAFQVKYCDACKKAQKKEKLKKFLKKVKE